MLPKLQQSSIAQSLRRDNPANHNYCNSTLIQARTNSKTLSVTPAMKIINPGRTNLPPKTHILPSAISLRNTCPNPNSWIRRMNQTTKAPFLVPSPNIREREELEASAQVPSKRRRALMNQSLLVGPSKNDKFHFQSSEDIMIGAIYLSELTIKVPPPNSSGRSLQKLWTITTTFLSSWTAADRKLIHIGHSLFWELTTSLRKVEVKSSPLSPNWSSP